ncbi:MAG: hypothetical protein KC425_19170 [Anaerolineales bacterium]|nr:hypothetical protein [Anaerolineales bacterium]
MITAWMWTHQGALRGLRIDAERQILYWHEEPGCDCDDTNWAQPLAEFLETGVPGWVGPLPADVAGELQEILHQLPTPHA